MLAHSALRIRLLLSSFFFCEVTTDDAAADGAKNRVMAHHMASDSTNGGTFEATGRVGGTAEQSERQGGKCQECFHVRLFGDSATGCIKRQFTQQSESAASLLVLHQCASASRLQQLERLESHRETGGWW